MFGMDELEDGDGCKECVNVLKCVFYVVDGKVYYFYKVGVEKIFAYSVEEALMIVLV